MPYARNQDLPPSVRPPSVRHVLPAHGQDIFRAAFNAAWESYGAKDPVHRETIAHRVAWAAVKHRYRKVGGHWLPIET